jgi:hypothetical protein
MLKIFDRSLGLKIALACDLGFRGSSFGPAKKLLTLPIDSEKKM